MADDTPLELSRLLLEYAQPGKEKFRVDETDLAGETALLMAARVAGFAGAVSRERHVNAMRPIRPLGFKKPGD